MDKITVGSVCSGIEAASVALHEFGFEVSWFSEISDFPARVLQEKYPDVRNLGDMRSISDFISSEDVPAPDVICGGTPCQAFSLAGWKKGLDDDRGNLTLKFVEILDENDEIRLKAGKQRSVVLWENVEGVLQDKTNPFGCFLSLLLGVDSEIKLDKWPLAGAIHGPKRNVAWRVLDAKYFGLPQQRRRLYVLAGDKDFYPENIIFDGFPKCIPAYGLDSMRFCKDGYEIEVFRGYTDCLYSAYGTKWNGNAAAYNGSLYIVQDEKIRRMTPLECERLMGFPDGYTDILGAKSTNRYQALGNSWAVPVIRWIGKRLADEMKLPFASKVVASRCSFSYVNGIRLFEVETKSSFNQIGLFSGFDINGSEVPEVPVLGDMRDIIDTKPDHRFYLSPVGCKGILRRKDERGIRINARLERILKNISSTMAEEDIEKVSRIQRRGRLSF